MPVSLRIQESYLCTERTVIIGLSWFKVSFIYNRNVDQQYHCSREVFNGIKNVYDSADLIHLDFLRFLSSFEGILVLH